MNILIQQGLIVTVIGMGLVFVVIVFFWWMMNALVKVTTKQEVTAETPEVKVPSAASSLAQPAGIDTRRRAAAAAVAVALAMNEAGTHKTSGMTQREMGGVNPWQSTHRASQLDQNIKRG